MATRRICFEHVMAKVNQYQHAYIGYSAVVEYDDAPDAALVSPTIEGLRDLFFRVTGYTLDEEKVQRIAMFSASKIEKSHWNTAPSK